MSFQSELLMFSIPYILPLTNMSLTGNSDLFFLSSTPAQCVSWFCLKVLFTLLWPSLWKDSPLSGDTTRWWQSFPSILDLNSYLEVEGQISDNFYCHFLHFIQLCQIFRADNRNRGTYQYCILSHISQSPFAGIVPSVSLHRFGSFLYLLA